LLGLGAWIRENPSRTSGEAQQHSLRDPAGARLAVPIALSEVKAFGIPLLSATVNVDQQMSTFSGRGSQCDCNGCTSMSFMGAAFTA
jgi:hypothetical protein